jgi:hypothetical protein
MILKYLYFPTPNQREVYYFTYTRVVIASLLNTQLLRNEERGLTGISLVNALSLWILNKHWRLVYKVYCHMTRDVHCLNIYLCYVESTRYLIRFKQENTKTRRRVTRNTTRHDPSPKSNVSSFTDTSRVHLPQYLLKFPKFDFSSAVRIYYTQVANHTQIIACSHFADWDYA